LIFFHGTSTTGIYTPSLHDALPISREGAVPALVGGFEHVGRIDFFARLDHEHHAAPVAQHSAARVGVQGELRVDQIAMFRHHPRDRKSTRLNSSHVATSYAVFCLKK